MKILEKYLPRNDGVFTFMLSEKKLFNMVASAVLQRPVSPEGEVISQLTNRENALLGKIVFDDAKLSAEELITLDMQRTFRSKRQKNREVYYSCRAISTQVVEKMRYEKLQPAYICFIMSEYDGGSPVQRIALCDLETKEQFQNCLRSQTYMYQAY